MWAKKSAHHPATGGHQTGGTREKKELQDLPSWQRPKSQQLVFQVKQLCVQGHKRVIVICEVLTWQFAQSVLFYLYSIIVYIHHSTIVTLQKQLQLNITLVLCMIYVICECDK